MKDKENHCVANFATFVPNWINKILVLIKILYFSDETRPSVRVHWVARDTCSVPGNFFQVGVCSRYNARSDWLIVTGHGPITGLQKPYNKLLTNRASSSRTGEYWPWVVFVRTSLR